MTNKNTKKKSAKVSNLIIIMQVNNTTNVPGQLRNKRSLNNKKNIQKDIAQQPNTQPKTKDQPQAVKPTSNPTTAPNINNKNTLAVKPTPTTSTTSTTPTSTPNKNKGASILQKQNEALLKLLATALENYGTNVANTITELATSNEELRKSVSDLEKRIKLLESEKSKTTPTSTQKTGVEQKAQNTPPKKLESASATKSVPALTTTTSKQTTPKQSAEVSTKTTEAKPSTAVEIKLYQDDLFHTLLSSNPEPLRIVSLSGETDEAIANANTEFTRVATKNNVYGVTILWNSKEEKCITVENEEVTKVTIRYIILSTIDTIYIYRVPSEQELKAKKFTHPLPSCLYKILTSKDCIKIGCGILDQVTMLFHNLGEIYVSPVAELLSLPSEKPATNVVAFLTEEFGIDKQSLAFKTNPKPVDYSKPLNKSQLISEAKKAWIELRAFEKSFQQNKKTGQTFYQYANSKLKIEK